MHSIWIILFALLAFTAAYFIYGKKAARWIGVDPKRETPAHKLKDGIDFVPTKKTILLGHHFSSIAGAAPIIGPIVAISYGWVPVILWIIIGGIFIGAIHDFTSLMASVRNNGGSIGEVIYAEIGKRGKILFLLFSWSTITLIVAVFTNIVADTFTSVPSAGTASIVFMLSAIVLGLLTYKFGFPHWALTLTGIMLIPLSLYIGTLFPLVLSFDTWTLFLFIYIFAASVLPVWLLLQPRDYLNSFMLYALIFFAFIGLVWVNPKINLPAFTSFEVNELGFLFPMLFVTVACGAISGFHSLISSGTSSKQLKNENDALFVSYGSMMIESFLAVIALVIVASVAVAIGKLGASNPVDIFADGFATLLDRLKIDFELAKTFASLTISAFALTSLDTATRLGRYAFQEFFSSNKSNDKNGKKESFLANRYVATIATITASGILIFSGQGLKIWPVFGVANQLLAVLALLAVTVWLTRTKRKSAFTRIPMYFMFVTTMTALVMMIKANFIKENYLLMIVSCILMILTLCLCFEAFMKTRKSLK